MKSSNEKWPKSEHDAIQTIPECVCVAFVDIDYNLHVQKNETNFTKSHNNAITLDNNNLLL